MYPNLLYQNYCIKCILIYCIKTIISKLLYQTVVSELLYQTYPNHHQRLQLLYFVFQTSWVTVISFATTTVFDYNITRRDFFLH